LSALSSFTFFNGKDLRVRYYWKKDKEFPHLSVSNRGRVRNDRTGNILKGSFNSKGYLCVTLYKKGKRYSVRIHKLVARNFLGPCPPGKEVNHKDGIKINCRADNLEYLTTLENNIHAFEMGLTSCMVKLNWKKVRRIRDLLKRGMTDERAAQKFGVGIRAISKIRLNLAWKDKNYIPLVYKNPCSKLNWKKVRRIRYLLEQGKTQWELSQRFKVSQPLISLISLNKVWIK